jgi:Uma2 family endonuclease
MATKWQATIDDLRRTQGKAELVHGELQLMSAAGGLHGYAAGQVYASLNTYAHATLGGFALGDNVGFIIDLPHRRSFSPDAAFYVGQLTAGFVQGAPIFAVEVRSPEDYGAAAELDLTAKRTDYFAAGTLVVWDVDVLRDHVVRVYRATAPETPTVYQRGEAADAEPAVPGWSMPVDSLFPPGE